MANQALAVENSDEARNTDDQVQPVKTSAPAPTIGRIVSVSGSEAIMVAERQQVDSSDAGQRFQIGTVVTIETGAARVIALVGAMTIPVPKQGDEESELKVAQLELLGEIIDAGDSPKFMRGVTSYPTLDDQVRITGTEELELIYAFPDVSTVKFGSLHQNPVVSAHLAVDDLLGKHFAVLGTTGTGKSCAVTLILRETLEQHKNGHIVLLDLHNEYASAFGDRAELLTAKNLELPYWLLTFEELKEIMVSNDGRYNEDEVSILADVVVRSKKTFSTEGNDDRSITVDTPVPYRLGDVTRLLDEAMGRLDKPNDSAPYLRLRSRLKTLQGDPRYSFMFQGLTVRDNMTSILAKLFRIPANGKPMTIVDLSSVPSEILNVVVSVVCRMTFDFALWSKQVAPILLVCEEAHRYAPRESNLGFEPTKRALARIAKEGRKYGVSLCLVSQRPSELDMTVLSQCSTIISFRIANQSDRDFVCAAMAESGVGLLEFLPSLRNGEAIVIGEGVAVPVRVMLDTLPEEARPRSGTASFSKAWDNDHLDLSLDDVVARWRDRNLRG